ncbi:ATP-binding cassette domain-containing protein [Gracilibacillus marinus]|uniref:ATP-binding cassette domain-containing protein n=1 Tax=Gracilibacillus marinus TaxID=630535 RepID=A0ABV8VWF9_9BACI
MTVVTVQQLSKKFKTTEVVKDITFQLEKNRCVALLGPNGAGKTTTLRMLSGLLKQTKGTIQFENQNGKDMRYYIGYLPQYPVFHSWMTGKEFLVYVGKLAYLTSQEAAKRADELLKKVDIYEARNKKVASYSGGMKQRLGIAQAMIHQPKLLILDEPVSALDPIGRREVLTLMEELKKQTTILFSTHILNDAEEVSDDLLVMHKGELVEAGSIEALRNKHQNAKFELEIVGDIHDYIDTIRESEFVDTIEQMKNTLHIYVHNVENARQDILSKAVAKKWPVTKFELSRTSLEDMFMKVVTK